jgi:hypothetical protein
MFDAEIFRKVAGGRGRGIGRKCYISMRVTVYGEVDVWACWANDYSVGLTMIYIKSLLIGVVALFVTTIVYVVILISVLLRLHPPPPGAKVGFDLLSILDRPSFWLVMLLAFAVGFYWQFRRAS